MYSHYGHNVVFGYNLDKHERIRISLHLNCVGSTFFEIGFKVYFILFFFWCGNLWTAYSSAGGSLDAICAKNRSYRTVFKIFYLWFGLLFPLFINTLPRPGVYYTSTITHDLYLSLCPLIANVLLKRKKTEKMTHYESLSVLSIA